MLGASIADNLSIKKLSFRGLIVWNVHYFKCDVSDNRKAYGVKGIISPLSEILPFPPPVMVEAVLLPFGNQIIIDSLLMPHNVVFGRGIVNDIKAEFRRLEESQGHYH